MKETIETGVRMVGHLLEHHGCVGPFFATAEGRGTHMDDPNRTQWCMAGAIDDVSERLGLSEYYGDSSKLTSAVMGHLGRIGSRVFVWEGAIRQLTTKEERLAIARKLQTYGL